MKSGLYEREGIKVYIQYKRSYGGMPFVDYYPLINAHNQPVSMQLSPTILHHPEKYTLIGEMSFEQAKLYVEYL